MTTCGFRTRRFRKPPTGNGRTESDIIYINIVRIFDAIPDPVEFPESDRRLLGNLSGKFRARKEKFLAKPPQRDFVRVDSFKSLHRCMQPTRLYDIPILVPG